MLANKLQLLDRIEPYKSEDKKEAVDTKLLHEKFLKMEKLIIDKNLFVRPKLDRGDVAKEMGMTTNEFNALFNQFSKLSFNNYINDLRMELAAKMLKDKQNYTIEAIATECGIPVRQDIPSPLRQEVRHDACGISQLMTTGAAHRRQKSGTATVAKPWLTDNSESSTTEHHSARS